MVLDDGGPDDDDVEIAGEACMTAVSGFVVGVV